MSLEYLLIVQRFAAANLDRHSNGPSFAAVIDALETDDKPRVQFLKACLLKLGLEVNQSDEPVPSLSPLHISSFHSEEVLGLLSQWKEIMTKTPSGEIMIQGDNDIFQFPNLPPTLQDIKAGSGKISIVDAVASLKLSSKEKDAEASSSSDRIVDYDKVVKQVMVHLDAAPSVKETPSFNHAAFYANLRDYNKSRFDESSFGKYLLYGEVVTSTSTMLEK
jgi:biotin--protein ligase